MADKNSIFDLADRLGYQSPLGTDWLNDFNAGANIPKIQLLKIEANKSPVYSGGNLLNISKNPDIIQIPVIATLLVKGVCGSATISCSNGQTKSVYPVHAGNGIYKATAEFNLQVAKAKVSVTGYNSVRFNFTAKVTDVSKKLADERTETVTADTNGKVLADFASASTEPAAGIKIVIDPGHGYTKGNTGAVCSIYTHKVMGKDEKPEKKPDGTFKEESHDIMDLPQYVIDDPNAWIVSKKEDPNHNERGLVFDIAVKLKALLEEKGYICFSTRDKKVIEGNDDSASRKKRIDLANNNKAQYFISIHADGASNYTASGSHVIYPKTADATLKADCIQLGKDVFRFYNVVQVESTSPKEDVRGLQVLGTTNKSSRKVLVELGFVTTPRDAKALFTNIDRIAEQLCEGIVYNVENSPL